MTEEDSECCCSGSLCHGWTWCEACDEYDLWFRCPMHCAKEHKEYK